MNQNNRIEHIDVWRCIAVSLVVAAHIINFSHPWYKEHMPGLVWRSMPFGLLGVQLFFCISGFVICRGMLKEKANTGTVSMRGFYIRRVFRILPPLMLYIGVLIVLSLTGLIDIEAKQIAYSIGFVCNVKEVNCGWFLGHTWSLAFEEQFYLLFPVMFLVLSLSTHRAKLLVTAIALCFMAAGANLTGHMDMAYYLSNFAYMVWGCVFALYWDKLKPVFHQLPFGVWALAPLILLAVHLIALPVFFHKAIYAVIAPVLIGIAVFGTPAHHAITRPIFESQILMQLGRISYSIYLWQQIATTNVGLSSPVPALLCIPCIIIIAYISFRHFETPMIAIGAAFSARASKRPVTPIPEPVELRDDIYKPL